MYTISIHSAHWVFVRFVLPCSIAFGVLRCSMAFGLRGKVRRHVWQVRSSIVGFLFLSIVPRECASRSFLSVVRFLAI